MPDQALARVVITLDSRRIIPPAVADALHRINRGGPTHFLHRTLTGAEPGDLFQLPLCWHAHQQQTGGTDEEWWLSVDHEAIDLARHFGTFCRDLVTCSDCLEWLRS